jgi:transposase InsO family protein
MFLIIVDAHSKWMDVQLMQSITTTKTVEKLLNVFATHGLPQMVVTDNGPSFTSSEFKDFMSRNGIKHTTSSPYHPSSNGLAERAVQSFKRAIEKITGQTVQEKLSKFLFKCRIYPHTTTGVPPAEYVGLDLDWIYSILKSQVR